MLYYGNGYFLQCLEGDESDILRLYQTLKADSRHTNVTQLRLEPVTLAKFASWHLKYAATDPCVLAFLQQQIESFNPYRLDDAQLSQFLNILYDAADHASSLLPTTQRRKPSERLYSTHSNLPDFQPEDHERTTPHFAYVLLMIMLIFLLLCLSYWWVPHYFNLTDQAPRL